MSPFYGSLEFSRRETRCFSAEKTDTSYPRASLGSCLWQLLATTGSHASNRAGLGLCWCCSLPRPLTGQKSPHRAKFGFSPQNEFTPPPKGGGAGYHLGWVCWGFHAEKPGTFPQEKTDTSYPRASLSSCHRQLLVTNGSHGFNRACLGLPWCRFPTLSPKPHTGPHGGEFGFGPLAGACQEDCPPFRQSRVRNRAEEKTLLPAFQKSNQLSSPSHASVFQNRQKKISFLCLAVQILRCHSRTPGHMLHGIFAHKQRTRPFHGRVLMYHLILWRGRLTPPRLAPICTPRPLGWAGSCTGAHRFVLCRLFPGRWSFLCR